MVPCEEVTQEGPERGGAKKQGGGRNISRGRGVDVETVGVEEALCLRRRKSLCGRNTEKGARMNRRDAGGVG